MENTTPPGAYRMLALTTLACTICFGVWMLNGVLVTFSSSTWGIGKAAIYRFIPAYCPQNVGGMVGVIGGLGGLVCPILLGYMLEGTGLWSNCWMLLILLSMISILWLNHLVHSRKALASPS